MAALCYNLKKHMKFQGEKALIEAKAPCLEAKGTFSAVYNAFFDLIRDVLRKLIFEITLANPEFD